MATTCTTIRMENQCITMGLMGIKDLEGPTTINLTEDSLTEDSLTEEGLHTITMVKEANMATDSQIKEQEAMNVSHVWLECAAAVSAVKCSDRLLRYILLIASKMVSLKLERDAGMAA